MVNKKFGLFKPTCNIETILDGRGGIFTWLPKEKIREFNMLYFLPGASRGDHYHPEFTEYFLVVDGSGLMVFKDSEKCSKEEMFHMSRGNCTYALPGIAHAFYAIKPVTAIAMLSKPWDECKAPIIHMDVTESRRKK